MRLLYYVKNAFTSFHGDAMTTSYDTYTPVKNQLAVAVPDGGEVATSEVGFINVVSASGRPP